MNFKKNYIRSSHYTNGQFHLSRNFSLQRVGDVNWLKKIMALAKLVIL